MTTLDALYYPFSRCIDSTKLKHLLLTFESITFLDPVEDEDWRLRLYQDLNTHDPRFDGYTDISSSIEALVQDGALRIVSPHRLSSIHHHLTAFSVGRDLCDGEWVRLAEAVPLDLPIQKSESGRPVWNVFRPKIPDKLVDLLHTDEFRSHLHVNGGERYAWVMSYAAGSSLGINTHLAAAEELGLAPVTDSRHHHKLLLSKLARARTEFPEDKAEDEFRDAIAQDLALRLMHRALPQDALSLVSIQDLIDFRNETVSVRRNFLDDLKTVVARKMFEAHEVSACQIASQAMRTVDECFEDYSNALNDVRDRLWPRLIESVTKESATATSALGAVGSYITGSHYVLAASLMLHALEPLKAMLEIRADYRSAQRSKSTSVAYLSLASTRFNA